MSDTIPIVLKLQADAMRPDIPVASLLRTAKAVATKLNLEDALVWIDLELNGYGKIPYENLPTYRQLMGEPEAYDLNSGWQPVHAHDPKILDAISKAPIAQPVGAIEQELRKDERQKGAGNFVVPYPSETKTMLMKAVGMPADMHIRLSSGEVFNIVEAVRNLILNWSLELEKAAILGEGLTFSAEEKAEAAPVTQQFFAQNIGIAGNVMDQARVTTVQAANLDLSDVGQLLDQIQQAMSLLPDNTQDKLKPVVAELSQELQADNPDESTLRRIMGSVRTICEGATSSIVAQGIISGLTKLLGG